MTINLQRLTHSLAFIYQRIGLAVNNPYNIGILYTYIIHICSTHMYSTQV